MSEMNSINEREGPAKNTSGIGQMDLSGMLGKLLANPQIIESVASALSGESATPPLQAEATVVPEKEKSASPDIADMAQKLPEIMSMLTPVLQQKGGVGSDKAHVVSDKRACLLSAMKPYMSPQRCEAIDYIIKFSQISEILKKIN